MATTEREIVPTEVPREPPGSPKRRVPWPWALAVAAALITGLVLGAAGWHATGSDETAATATLARRYVAAGLWTGAQAQMFSPNAVWIDEASNDVATGFVLAAIYPDGHLMYTRAKETIVSSGPDGFVTAWTIQGPTQFSTPKRFTVHGVTVNQVTAGEITLQRVYYDPGSFRGVYGSTRSSDLLLVHEA